jgi:hypothetical protein
MQVTLGTEEPRIDRCFLLEDAPLNRYVIEEKSIDSDPSNQIVVHEFRDVKQETVPRVYCKVHTHPYEERFIIVGDLTARIRIGNEVLIAGSRCKVIVPANTRHSVNVIQGTGSILITKH